MRRVHVHISGRVQGVFFRAVTQQTARDFNLTGWVRNMPDGRLEAVFEGNDENVDKMLDWCHIGPPSAIVEKVVTVAEPFTGEFMDFHIK